MTKIFELLKVSDYDVTDENVICGNFTQCAQKKHAFKAGVSTTTDRREDYGEEIEDYEQVLTQIMKPWKERQLKLHALLSTSRKKERAHLIKN